MASKSKKRRRVLGASCILAALIIAGSSFAWFTSKDEVTNRLQASSDYGVSIVESFTPPKNMLPGQEVNKDVYAVNTGNIAAFVKEDVSGVLNYTFESKVASWDDKCVELTLEQAAAIEGATMKDGYKTMEAGGYLAWTDATSTSATGGKTYSINGTEITATEIGSDSTYSSVPNSSNGDPLTFTKKYNDGTKDYYLVDATDGAKLYEIKNQAGTPATYYEDSGKVLSIKDDTTASPAITPGPIYSGRTQDLSDPAPWTPTETGTYIFRRSIGGTADTPTFEYAGYYYDKTSNKYYKIVIGDDEYRAAKEDPTTTPNSYEFDVSAPDSALAGVTINKDGEITAGTPKISFVKDTKVTDQKVTFTYEDAAAATSTDPAHGPRLVALYAADAPTTTINGVEYDASAMAARTEVDYNNKLGEANRATVDYEQNKADYDYAKALSGAATILKNAAQTRYEADQALNAADGAKAKSYEAWNNLKDAVTNSSTGLIANYNNNVKKPYLVNYTIDGTAEPNNIGVLDADDDSGSPYVLGQLFDDDVIARINSNTPFELPKAKENLAKMGQLATKIGELDGELWTNLKNLATKTDADEYTPTNVATDISNMQATVAKLKKAIEDYKDAYSQIVDDGATQTATGLNLSNAATTKTALQGLADTLDGLKDDLDTLAATYKEKYDAYKAAEQANTKAQETWEKAIDTYNQTVGNPPVAASGTSDEPGYVAAKDATGARGAYEAVVNKTAPTIQTPTALNYVNHSDPIVAESSANKTANGTDPQITKNPNDNQWSTLKDLTIKVPTETEYSLTTKKDAMDAAVEAANTAKGAYDDAKDALAAASTIKIYVNLAEDYATNWQIDDADKTGSQDVDFYLKKILEAGETSKKLIDSVELADTTTARDYKNLTFDLNVGLDSAQITYANDQRTITTEAVKADNNFILKPTAATYDSADAAVAWATPTP